MAAGVASQKIRSSGFGVPRMKDAPMMMTSRAMANTPSHFKTSHMVHGF